jgi:hypothetical protein
VKATVENGQFQPIIRKGGILDQWALKFFGESAFSGNRFDKFKNGQKFEPKNGQTIEGEGEKKRKNF